MGSARLGAFGVQVRRSATVLDETAGLVGGRDGRDGWVVDSRTAPRSRDQCPPQSGPVTAPTRRSAPSRRSTVPAGGTTGATRCPSQGLGLQVIAARAGPEHRSRTRSVARPRALAVGHADGRPRSTSGSTSRTHDRPSPGLPRAARVPRRRLRPVAAVAWRTRRPPRKRHVRSRRPANRPSPLSGPTSVTPTRHYMIPCIRSSRRTPGGQRRAGPMLCAPMRQHHAPPYGFRRDPPPQAAKL